MPAGQACPTLPPTPDLGAPTYGDTVKALSACTGGYIPDQLTVGALYRVVGLFVEWDGPAPVPNMPVGTTPTGVILNPLADDGLHRGDSYYAYWVPMTCVAKTVTPASAAAAPLPFHYAVLYFLEPESPAPAPAPDDSYLAVGIRYCPNVTGGPAAPAYSAVLPGRRYRVSRSRAGVWAFKAIPYVSAHDLDHPALGDAIVSEHDCLRATK